MFWKDNQNMPQDIIWETTPRNRLEINERSWSWDNIRDLIHSVVPLSNIRITNVSNLAYELYGYLPEGQQELQEVVDYSKRLYRLTFRSSCPRWLRPYRNVLRELVQSARMKLGTVLTRPNQRSWSKEAWRFYQELQINLARRSDVYCGEITFRTLFDYEQTNRRLRDIQRNIFWRAGFECVVVVAWHARSHSEEMRNGSGRIHAHFMVWSRERRPARDIAIAVRRVRIALSEGRYGAGLFRLQRPRHFLSAAAYLAWNYHSTSRLDKGQWNPIPCGAKLLRRPRNQGTSIRWQRVGPLTFLTPRNRAWRDAAGRHAAITGSSHDEDLRWMWRERRLIRSLLDPPQYLPPIVNGLDGYEYSVRHYGEDAEGRECYLLSNARRGGFILTVQGLTELASLEIAAGAFREDWRNDLTTGRRAIWRDVLGINARQHIQMNWVSA